MEHSRVADSTACCLGDVSVSGLESKTTDGSCSMSISKRLSPFSLKRKKIGLELSFMTAKTERGSAAPSFQQWKSQAWVSSLMPLCVLEVSHHHFFANGAGSCEKMGQECELML